MNEVFQLVGTTLARLPEPGFRPTALVSSLPVLPEPGQAPRRPAKALLEEITATLWFEDMISPEMQRSLDDRRRRVFCWLLERNWHGKRLRKQKQVADDLGVNVRTIRRDVEEISSLVARELYRQHLRSSLPQLFKDIISYSEEVGK